LAVKNVSILWIVPIVALLSCQAPVSGTGHLSEEEVAAIEGASDRWAQALATDDDVAALEELAEDAVLMPPNSPSVEGVSSVQALYQEYEPMQFEVTREAIEGRGDLAYERARYIITPATGDGAPIRGKYVNIWKRQGDGSWLLAVNVWNTSAY
jgi:ketosteroid isomerase-like protein